MEHALKNDLHAELLSLKNEVRQTEKTPEKTRPVKVSENVMVEAAFQVTERLKEKPYLTAEEIERSQNLSRDHLALIYKMIQRSKMCQSSFSTSKNRDYFSVVNHYFNHRLFTLVFFVGNTCPTRCIFCPSVKVGKDGHRSLKSYGHKKKRPIDETALEKVFDDLSAMKKKGSGILVKISGGLEPLTDIITVSAIVHHARNTRIPVKLFTNGLLFTDPLRRTAALQTDDIRISLSTADDDQYKKICFPPEDPYKGHSLARLKQNIRDLVSEREKNRHYCKIGLNCLILPENHDRLVSLLEMARNLGLDYVDFKPDYFSSYDEKTVEKMEDSIREVRTVAAHPSYSHMVIHFTGSLSRQDMYWENWNGTCDILPQSGFKMFITPYGECSPVHYGAFPHSARSFNREISTYSIGEIGGEKSLRDVIQQPSKPPEIDVKKLNPFELMMNLEINREEKDKAHGLPLAVSPYHTRARKKIPANLLSRIQIRD